MLIYLAYQSYFTLLMSRTLFMFMTMMKFWKIFQTSRSYYVSFFEKQFKKNLKINFFWIFLPLDLESPVTFFRLGFGGFWKCLTGFPRLCSDVTFRVDDFSYRKLFNPSSYEKVMPFDKFQRDFAKKFEIHICKFSQ